LFEFAGAAHDGCRVGVGGPGGGEGDFGGGVGAQDRDVGDDLLRQLRQGDGLLLPGAGAGEGEEALGDLFAAEGLVANDHQGGADALDGGGVGGILSAEFQQGALGVAGDDAQGLLISWATPAAR